MTRRAADMNLVQQAAEFAACHHRHQLYGNLPYIVHLCDVVWTLVEFGHDNQAMLAAGFLHDVVEDCDISIDRIESLFGVRVAVRVEAVTGIGKNRAERKASMIASLQAYSPAVPLKMADRLSNIRASVRDNPSKLEMYRAEAADYAELFEAADPEMHKAIKEALGK